jgi:ribosomal protein L7/L12
VADGGATGSPGTGGDIATWLRQGRKIEAIKLYRAQTGVGLAEAKAAVEAMERGAPLPPGPDAPAPEGIDGRLWELLKKGQKIEAIKLYRDETGVGLAEAKAAVEAIAGQHGIPMKSAGCAAMILLGIVPVIGTVGWILTS